MLDVSKMVDAVLSALDKPLSAMAQRIKMLEERQPERGADGKDGRDGADGKDASPVSPDEIAAAVAKYLADNPPPAGKDGRDGNNGAPGEKGADGRNGADVVDLLIDRDGALVATLSDGRTKTLGPVLGKDGAAGDAGKDGSPGKDGVDGFGFDDLQVIHDGARGFTFRFAKGERIKDFAFSLPVVLDCGVYKEGQAYQGGDGVTWAGSFWIAQEETKEKPDSGKGWRLAVKRGRDGKDGVLKAEKPKEPVRVG